MWLHDEHTDANAVLASASNCSSAYWRTGSSSRKRASSPAAPSTTTSDLSTSLDRLLVATQAYAEMKDRWLRTADDLLGWIIVLDRLLACPGFRPAETR
jgi:hypothetical protein